MNLHKQNIRLFGRSRGRGNKTTSLEDYYNIIEQYRFKQCSKNINYILDIGTGYGETSIFLAKNNKDKIIISCEKYIDGNLNLTKNIQKENITNIKLHSGNVYEILDNLDNNEYFESMWIFFPDPWPKKKHYKRRLITFNFLKKIHNNIKPKGEVIIATDSVSYTKFILNCIYEVRNLYNWINQYEVNLSIKDYFNLETKFYKKAILEGREPILLILKKI